MNALGNFITERRIEKKLSIRKLAELANISHTEIYRLEHGERKHPSPLILKSIAQALEVNFSEIMKAAKYIDDDFHSKIVPNILLSIYDLDDRELQEVLDFIDFLRSKRKKTEKSNTKD